MASNPRRMMLGIAAFAMAIATATAWTGSTIALNGAVPPGRSPVMVLTPSGSAAHNASLPLVLLLQSRCQGLLGIDAVFHFTNIVDTVRARRDRGA